MQRSVLFLAKFWQTWQATRLKHTTRQHFLTVAGFSVKMPRLPTESFAHQRVMLIARKCVVILLPLLSRSAAVRVEIVSVT